MGATKNFRQNSLCLGSTSFPLPRILKMNYNKTSVFSPVGLANFLNKQQQLSLAKTQGYESALPLVAGM